MIADRRRRRSGGRLAGALAVAVLALAPAGASAYSEVTQITGSGVSDVVGTAMNAGGDVVGLATFGDQSGRCGFLWHAGTLTELPSGHTSGTSGQTGCDGTTGSGFTYPLDVNDSDEIAGEADFPFTSDQNSVWYPSLAATWQGTDAPTDLGSNCADTYPGDDEDGVPGYSVANAVNATGTAVGATQINCPSPGNPTGTTPFEGAWLTSPTNVIATGTADEQASAIAVNSGDHALVYWADDLGCASDCPAPQASLYSGGSLTALPVIPSANGNYEDGYYSGQESLNDSDVVVGDDASDPLATPVPAFSADGGTAVDLTPADGLPNGIATAVDNDGDVVGDSENAIELVPTLWPGAAPPASPASEPAGIDVSTLIPSSLDLDLYAAVGIDDKGQILAQGSYEGPEPGTGSQETLVITPLIVTSTGDQPESGSATPGVCDDGSGACTLRAAIQVANGSAGATMIAFDIPGATGMPKISPASPLPAITNSGTTIDGASQPGTASGQPGVQIDGSGAGAGADGLQLDGANMTVEGMDVTGFGGDAIDIETAGAGATVQGSWIGVAPGGVVTANNVGIEADASNVTIGGAGAGQGDVISGNGHVSTFESDEASLGHDSPGALDSDLTRVGGGIVADPSTAASNLQIVGDLIGPAPDGSGLGGFSNAVGILLEGSSSGVTIGGFPPSGDEITGSAIGIAAVGASVGDVLVAGDLIGPLPDGSTSNDTGNGIGLYAGQGVTGLSIGASGLGNTFEDDVVGAALAGLSGPKVRSNTFGADEGVTSTDGRTNVLGLALLDTTGAVVGGPGSDGNQLTGDDIGALVAGTGSSGNAISGNTIGRATDLGLGPSKLDGADMGSVFGLLLEGGSANTISGNHFAYAGLGLGIAGSSSNTVTSNTLIGNFFGLWAIDGSHNTIGAAGAGNTIERNNVGLLLLDQNLAAPEQGFAGLPSSSDADQSSREQDLSGSQDQDELAFASAASTATVGPSTMDVPAGTGSDDTIQANTIGGSGQGNDIGAILGGDLSATLVGGTAAGEANTISDDHEAGVWILGWAGHQPSVAVLGNSIFDNYDGTISDDKPGLGIDLAGLDANGGPLPANGFGPNAPDHSVQPDPSGPNGLQNYPVLTGATPVAGKVQVTGRLTSARDRSYAVELFANTACNVFGYGEGQQLVGDQTVTTNASGVAAFSDSVPVSLPSARVITATATSLVGGVPANTSEFSACETIGSHGSSPPSFSGASASGGTSPVSGGTATVSLSCPASAPGPCEGSAELTVLCTGSECAPGMVADPAAAARAKGKRHPKPKPVTVVLAKAAFKIAAGRTAKLKLRLSGRGRTLLAQRHKLAATLTVTSHAGASASRATHAKLVLESARKRGRRTRRLRQRLGPGHATPAPPAISTSRSR